MTNDEKTARKLLNEFALGDLPPAAAKEIASMFMDVVPTALTAARAEALEEAAKVAESCGPASTVNGEIGREVAKSIRALPAARARSEEARADEELGRNVRALLAEQSVEKHKHANPLSWYASVVLRRFDVDVEGQPQEPKFYVNVESRAAGIDTSLDAAVAAARRGQ